MSHSRNVNGNMHREDDIFDLTALFRKLKYQQQPAIDQQLGTLKKGRIISIAANKIIAEVTRLEVRNI